VLDKELVLVLVLLRGEEILILSAVGVEVLGEAVKGDLSTQLQLLVTKSEDADLGVLQELDPARVVRIAIELDDDAFCLIELEL
jgi:hypothetical protein